MDKFLEELKALKDLEVAGTLNDTQKVRIEELKALEEADKTAKSALAQKDHFRTKFEEEEKARKAAEEKAAKAAAGGKGTEQKPLDVDDYIGISTALEGLDSREKEYLARQHKLTGKPLHELRKDEDFQFWDQAYKAKVEKESKVMAPSSGRPTEQKPQSLEEKVASASTLAEKEKLLIDAGLYTPPRGKRPDQVNIGPQR